MLPENKTLNFNNQTFFIGIDVHDKSWSVAITSNKLLLKSLRINSSALELSHYMKQTYPGGKYYSVYEAGFCGYSVHRELEKEGFINKIAAPTEIPTSVKEKDQKRDPVDAKKLARELENGSIKGIYIPTILEQEFRSLVRLRQQQIRIQTRLKNQIKGYLHFYGHRIPDNYKLKHWSQNFISYLRALQFTYPIGKTQMDIYLDDLDATRKKILNTVKAIRKYLEEYKLTDKIRLLMSVPGVGFTTAVTLLSELYNINRFKIFDKLAKYCGLVPSVRSSSTKTIVLGITSSSNRRVRELLIESAWIAVRIDPAMTHAYNTYILRMSKQEAIIRIAKKLLSRIRYVMISGKPYCKSVVK
jgi:transposase